jgi:hypothetical protein
MTEYNSCKPYSEILTYKIILNNEEFSETTLGDRFNQ